MKRIFISFPYTHAKKSVIKKRIALANLYSYEITLGGGIPFAPAVIGHEMLEEIAKNDIRPDSSFASWAKFCYAYLDLCNELHVLMIPGWKESVGILAEVTYATKRGIKVIYKDV